MLKETISAGAAERAKSEIFSRITPREVAEQYSRVYLEERRLATLHDKRLCEADWRTRAIYRIYIFGVNDALRHITKREREPDEEPDEIETGD